MASRAICAASSMSSAAASCSSWSSPPRNLVVTTGRGRILVDGNVEQVGPELADAIREHRETIGAIYAGGHVWAQCTACGAGTVTAVLTTRGKRRDKWPSCRMTPRCGGQHRPHDAQIDALIAARVRQPPEQREPPPKRDRRRLLGPRPSYPPR